MTQKLGDWGIKNGPFSIKITTRHKIRQWIGLTGSMVKDGNDYYFYGIIKEKYNILNKIHNKFLKKITPLLNNKFILGHKK